MKGNIIEVVEKYLSEILMDEFHRYRSWDRCYNAFSTSSKNDSQTLELGFYLASWGMYRGSGGLLQKNHMIHSGAVDIVFLKKNHKLKCSQTTEVKREDINSIFALKDELADHYGNIYFIKGTDKPKPISTTDTLLSKIILGTLGCVPAYDRYFIEGLRLEKLKHKSFTELSLKELFKFVEDNKAEFLVAQGLIKIKTQNHYPIMKILDMYFWQIGYDKELMENRKNE